MLLTPTNAKLLREGVKSPEQWLRNNDDDFFQIGMA